ncbi:hypothetical protein AAG570_006510 [Ranatra chinensis]|uniref:Uncharacterized protein n=1 Tax=Ranatra chinensis TaxID=642074 RepID=A0ABD0Z4T2_9HEMI
MHFRQGNTMRQGAPRQISWEDDSATLPPAGTQPLKCHQFCYTDIIATWVCHLCLAPSINVCYLAATVGHCRSTRVNDLSTDWTNEVAASFDEEGLSRLISWYAKCIDVTGKLYTPIQVLLMFNGGFGGSLGASACRVEFRVNIPTCMPPVSGDAINVNWEIFNYKMKAARGCRGRWKADLYRFYNRSSNLAALPALRF